jgi:hypothetical protein
MEAELEKLVAQQEAKFRKTFNEWVKSKRDQETLRQLQELLEQGRIEEALDLMTDSQNFWPLLFLQVYVAAGVWEAIQSPFDFRFNPLSNDFPSSQVNIFSSFMDSSQRQMLREVLYQGYRDGKSWQTIAREMQRNVGLSSRQRITLNNYERLLREVKDGKTAFTEAQIKRMLVTRRNQLIESRAKMIARDQAIALIEKAREDAFAQGLATEGLFPNQATKTWNSRGDDRVRFYHTHASLDGQTVPLDQAFVSASGARLLRPHDSSLGAPLSETAGCRCFLSFAKPEGL